MPALKYLLMILGVGLFGSAGALVVYDIYISEQLRRLLARNKASEAGAGTAGITVQRPFGPVRWRLAQRLAISGVLPILPALSIVAIPDGSAGLRVSQIWGARRGTLHPGVHFVTPLGVFGSDQREQQCFFGGFGSHRVPLVNTPVGGSGCVAGKEEGS
jgi:hypothetical protein